MRKLKMINMYPPNEMGTDAALLRGRIPYTFNEDVLYLGCKTKDTLYDHIGRTVYSIKQEVIDEEEEFVCPITLCRMSDPVLASDGNYYEYDALKKWLALKGKSPLTNLPMASVMIRCQPFFRRLEAWCQRTGKPVPARPKEFGLVGSPPPPPPAVAAPPHPAVAAAAPAGHVRLTRLVGEPTLRVRPGSRLADLHMRAHNSEALASLLPATDIVALILDNYGVAVPPSATEQALRFFNAVVSATRGTPHPGMVFSKRLAGRHIRMDMPLLFKYYVHALAPTATLQQQLSAYTVAELKQIANLNGVASRLTGRKAEVVLELAAWFLAQPQV